MDNQQTPQPDQTPTNTLPTPSVMSSSKKKKKPVLLVVLLLLIVALALGAMYYWQDSKNKELERKLSTAQTEIEKLQTKETAIAEDAPATANAYTGWSTYNNDKYLVSFKYPAGWKTEEVAGSSPGSASSIAYAVNLNFNIGEKYNTAGTLEIYPAKVDMVVAEQDKYYGQSPTNKIEKSTVTINGKQATKYVITNSGVVTTHVFIGVGDKTYTFRSVNEALNVKRSTTYNDDISKVISSITIK